MAKPTFQIGRGSGVCAASGRTLRPGDEFVATLVERPESEELDRLDFGLEEWEAGQRPAGRVFAFWRGMVCPPEARRRALIDDEALLELFEQLAGQNEPRRVAFRFVLALILIRKRILACEQTRGTTMLVRVRGAARREDGADLSEVLDPGLDDATIAEVTEQFSAVMAGGDPLPAGGGAAGERPA